KLLDFGIAKAADRITRTETGVLKGKFAYMSPEHCRGKELDRRSDVFALGVILYELLASKRLYQRGSELAIMKAILDEPVPPLVGVDRGLAAICMHALAKRREDRFPTALDMRKHLLSWSHGTDLDEVLGALMQRLFEERIVEKREMLKKIR